MSGAGLLGTIIIFSLSVLLLVMPFFTARKTGAAKTQSQQIRQRDELLTTYERVVAMMRDLEEDRLTGKLDDETYQREHAMWSDRGVQVLAKLDEMGMSKAQIKAERKKRMAQPTPKPAPKPQPKPATANNAEAELDDAIEAAISRYADSLKAK